MWVEYRGANKSDVSTVRSDTSSLYQMVGRPCDMELVKRRFIKVRHCSKYLHQESLIDLNTSTNVYVGKVYNDGIFL